MSELSNSTPASGDKLSRIEYLLELNHDLLEGQHDSYDGLNYLELVENQLNEGQIDLALFNISQQAKYCFEIANLYWGQGNLRRAEKYLRMTLERYRRFVAAGMAQGQPQTDYDDISGVLVKSASVLLDEPIEGLLLTIESEPGYSPAFGNYLLDCCLGHHDFDMGLWQSLEDAWLKNRFPKYMLEEQAVYVNALTGGYASDTEMLEAHQAMWLGKAKRSPDSDLLDGYSDNELIIDYTFATVLKRIGWQGTYRHSWPNTCPIGAEAITTRPADRHLAVIAAPPPAPDAESGIIEDSQVARRYIDTYVADQRDWWENEHFDATRPAKERSKVSGALKALGWKADKATLDLMRTYRMNEILNDSTHIFLADPVGDGGAGMQRWTQLFVDEFGLHPDFIAVAESEERSDYRDPEGGWYVYWKKDKRIYSVQRDDWSDPQSATSNARLGKELWPSYLSFVAWWVSEHQAGGKSQE
ncbi:MAG: tetratricopeptide repeat protein [Woeseiaceae bacterium]|nr:tetratricopeptide repeat protein [Woeseiaceae bacterium]